MRVPKKHPKNHSRNRFWKSFWAPKPSQKPRKIFKNRFENDALKRTRKKEPSRPKKKTCLSKEREARTFLKVAETCNCKGPKFPTRGNKTSRSRSTQSSSSKQRKVPDSSRAVHAPWAMETQRNHQRASLARFARSLRSPHAKYSPQERPKTSQILQKPAKKRPQTVQKSKGSLKYTKK